MNYLSNERNILLDEINRSKEDIKKLYDENNVLRMFIKNGKDEDASTKEK